MEINWKHLVLGIMLNVLVIIVSLIIYHAYTAKSDTTDNINIPDANALEQGELAE